MTNNTLENPVCVLCLCVPVCVQRTGRARRQERTGRRIERLVSRESYLNQPHLVEELILNANPDWIDHIENYYDESSDNIFEVIFPQKARRTLACAWPACACPHADRRASRFRPGACREVVLSLNFYFL